MAPWAFIRFRGPKALNDAPKRRAAGRVLKTLRGFGNLTLMIKTVILNAEIPASRELRVTLPADVPTGSAEIVITVNARPSAPATLHDLLNSEFLGMWSDRADITDGAEFARKLRSESWDNS